MTNRAKLQLHFFYSDLIRQIVAQGKVTQSEITDAVEQAINLSAKNGDPRTVAMQHFEFNDVDYIIWQGNSKKQGETDDVVICEMYVDLAGFTELPRDGEADADDYGVLMPFPLTHRDEVAKNEDTLGPIVEKRPKAGTVH